MTIRDLSILAACALLALMAAAPVVAQDAAEERPVVRGAENSAPVTPFVFDGDVRDLPAPLHWQPGDPIKEIPRRFYPPPGSGEQYESQSVGQIDPLLEVRLIRGARREAGKEPGKQIGCPNAHHLLVAVDIIPFAVGKSGRSGNRIPYGHKRNTNGRGC